MFCSFVAVHVYVVFVFFIIVYRPRTALSSSVKSPLKVRLALVMISCSTGLLQRSHPLVRSSHRRDWSRMRYRDGARQS